MSKSTNGFRKAGIASIATTLVLGAGVAAGAGSASALPGFEFDRLPGDNRYDTAAMAADTYTDIKAAPVTDVILANGTEGHYPDALAGNYLAGLEDAPILLTRADRMPDHTADKLADLNPANVWLVGGDAVISPELEAQLSEDYNVVRLGGENRYETTAEVIRHGGVAASDTAVISTGLDFADSLAAGPMVYSEGYPLGLTRRDRVPAPIIDALQAAEVEQAIIVGGEGVVGAGARDDLNDAGITVIETLQGDDRAATSVEVAEYELTELGFTDTAVNAASGYVQGDGADALAGGPVTGEQERPLLITRSATNVDDQDDEILGFLQANCDTLAEGLIFGGTGALSTGAENEMEEAAVCDVTSNQDFTVTPQGAATLTVANPDDATDDRTYTVSGLDDATTYTVALFDADNVTVDANGVVSFADTDNDNLADGYGDTSIAEITKRNSQNITATGATTISPVNGTLNFTIDGVAPGTVVPVLFVDAGTANEVDLNADNQPTEQFGVGGETTYLATAAASGAYAGSVDSVDKAANTFVATVTGTAPAPNGTFTFTYDGNDAYTVNGVSVGMAAFEAALSADDDIATTYTTDADGVSTFALDDVAPPAPTSVEAEKGTTAQTTNDITVTVVIPAGADYDSVVIQRATVTGGTDENADGTVGTYATIAQPTTDAVAGGDFQYIDNDVPAGTYRYRAALVNDGDQGAFTADAANETSVTPPAPDTTAPTSVDAFVGVNGGSAFLLEDGDTFRVVFSEVVAAPTNGDTIRLRDEDGTVVDVVARDGGDADTDPDNFVLNAAAETIGTTEYAAGRILTVTRTAGDVTVAAGTLASLGIPAEITQQSGTVDPSGNAWNLAGSADTSVDSE